MKLTDIMAIAILHEGEKLKKAAKIGAAAAALGGAGYMAYRNRDDIAAGANKAVGSVKQHFASAQSKTSAPSVKQHFDSAQSKTNAALDRLHNKFQPGDGGPGKESTGLLGSSIKKVVSSGKESTGLAPSRTVTAAKAVLSRDRR